MTIAIGTIGAFTIGTGNRTPAFGGTYAIGDLILYNTGQYQGSNTLTFPDNTYTLLTPNVSCKQVQVYGKIATSTSETIPTVNWGATAQGFAQLCTLTGVDSSLTNLISAAERISNSNANIVGIGSTRTPSQNNAIMWFLGERNKTSTSDGTSYSTPTNWTIAAQSHNNGTNPSIVVAYWIQTTATAVASSLGFNGSIADGSAQSMQATMIALGMASAAVITPTRSLLGVGT